MYKIGLFSGGKYRSKLKVLAITLGISGVLAYMSWNTVGEHFEDDYADPLGGPVNLVADENKPPTGAERNRAATTIFLVTFLPFAAGGLQKDETSTETKSRNR